MDATTTSLTTQAEDRINNPKPETNPRFVDVSQQGGDAGRWDSQCGWHTLIGQMFHGKTILDVGAGLGHSRARLAGLDQSNAVTLHDIAPGMPVDLTCPLGDIPARSFDVVSAFDVIEHVPDDAGFVADLCRIARERVVITTPNWRVSKCGNNYHVREYAPDQLVDLVTSYGIHGLYTDRDGSGQAVNERSLAAFLASREAALGVVLRGGPPDAPEALCDGQGSPSVSSPAASIGPASEIWIGGFPSAYGGADTELDHMIDLWLAHGIGVHLVPNVTPDPTHLASVVGRGCHAHQYHSSIFAGKIVVSYCNGEFLKRLPEICSNGRPACVVWVNCMTWNFPDELAAHAAGLIDRFVFHSDYQRSMIGPALEALRPLRDLAGYRPFFNMNNALQQLRFTYREPAAYFGMGRVSRDDAYKFPDDLWKIFAQVTAPLPTKTFVLGFGANAANKCGNVPPCNWLDWMTWTPGGTTPVDLYSRIHVLIHKTGGSRENWPRTILEAMASGVAVVAEDDWALPQLIENGVTGFLCRSSDEMSYRASQLAFDEPLRKRMVHAAYERFLHEHANAERSFAPWRVWLAPAADNTSLHRGQHFAAPRERSIEMNQDTVVSGDTADRLGGDSTVGPLQLSADDADRHVTADTILR
jgi:glycosyltransferase involved in cell wall biosynthesis